MVARAGRRVQSGRPDATHAQATGLFALLFERGVQHRHRDRIELYEHLTEELVGDLLGDDGLAQLLAIDAARAQQELTNALVRARAKGENAERLARVP